MDTLETEIENIFSVARIKLTFSQIFPPEKRNDVFSEVGKYLWKEIIVLQKSYDPEQVREQYITALNSLMQGLVVRG